MEVQKIDEDLYSRQMAVYGEAMGKLIKLKIFLYGLRGVGVETAKNLILSGPNTVTLCDKEMCQITDLGSNFYIKEQDVGKKSRAQACLPELKELNSAVKVSVYDQEITTEYLSQFNVVVFTDFYDKKKLIEFNAFCHKNNIGFIYGGELGLYGFAFVDFGDKHKVFDLNGEEPRTTIVANISKDEKGIVTVHEDKRHGFFDNDYVTFKEVQGMDEVNDQVYKINILNPFSFSIECDTRKFKDYTREGLVQQVKVPIEFSFHPLEHSLEIPYAPKKKELDNPDFEKMLRPELLHLLLNSILNFYEKNHHLPQLHNKADAQTIVNMTKELNESNKQKMDIEGIIKLEQIDEKVIEKICLNAKTQISPISAFWGGIICQEIVKYTGKFTPLSQWLHYDVLEILPDKEVTHNLEGHRYDDYISIFGNQALETIKKQNIFIIGAGALGCEFLKQFALMGFGCGTGKVIVTDDDIIEVSNLNRQFLFRKTDVGHAKSERAKLAAQRMNKNFNIESLKLRVCPETEEYFNDLFWEKQSFIVNALDNIKARLYIDSKCVFYKKSLFESGTLGTKCNSQVILPNFTQSYGDSQDPAEESIPLCTLKNFPHQIEHTIQWARDYFQGQFTDGAKMVSAFIEKPQGIIDKLKEELQDRPSVLCYRLEVLNIMVSAFHAKKIESCVELARLLFEDSFHNQISQLLHSFPLDHKTSEGQLFWSGPKRAPQILNYSSTDFWTQQFIFSASKIFSLIFNIKDKHHTQQQITEICDKLKMPTFVPKSVKVSENEQDLKIEEASALADEKKIKDLEQKLLGYKFSEKTVNDIEFEKDDDTNHHVDFIASTANLRARNYKIPEVDRFKIKIIAGKIMPAIATTTAMIVGAVGIEWLKLVQQKAHTVFKNSFMNLALPLWLFSEPLPPIKMVDKDYDEILLGPVKAIPPGFTNWDKIWIDGPMTLGQLLEFLTKKYNVEATIISHSQYCIFNKYAGKQAEIEKKKAKDIVELIQDMSKKKFPEFKKYIELEISSETHEGIDAIMPTVVLLLPKK